MDVSRLLGEGCSTSAVTLTGVWALSFFPDLNAEPSYEELKERVAELERKTGRTGDLIQSRRERRRQRVRSWPVPGDALLRAVGAPAGRQPRPAGILENNKDKLKLKQK